MHLERCRSSAHRHLRNISQADRKLACLMSCPAPRRGPIKWKACKHAACLLRQRCSGNGAQATVLTWLRSLGSQPSLSGSIRRVTTVTAYTRAPVRLGSQRAMAA